MNAKEIRETVNELAERIGASYGEPFDFEINDYEATFEKLDTEIFDFEFNELEAAFEKLSLNFEVEFHHLYQQLETEKDEVVFEGLISAFIDSGYKNYGFIKQEIAGCLLFLRKPKPTKSLQEILDLTLKSYNLSIRTFPWYLKYVFGEKALKDEIKRRMKWRWIKLRLSKRKTISIETFGFWLSARESSIKEVCKDPERPED